MEYFSVLYVVLFTVYGQLIIKWRMTLHDLPTATNLLTKFSGLIMIMLRDPFILSGLFSAFLASLVWMNIIKKLQLNIAYPIMSLSFVLVFFFSVIFFQEEFNWLQVLGLVLIITGVSFIGLSVVK